MTITHISEREQALQRENERYKQVVRIQSAMMEAQQESIISLMDDAALKAQPEQQPRAYIAFSENGEHISYWTRSLEDAQTWTGRTNKKCEPFYPAPVQPAPLTDEQIFAACRPLYGTNESAFMGRIDDLQTARAIDAAIKGGAT